jgi:hypothetical protein
MPFPSPNYPTRRLVAGDSDENYLLVVPQIVWAIMPEGIH